MTTHLKELIDLHTLNLKRNKNTARDLLQCANLRKSQLDHLCRIWTNADSSQLQTAQKEMDDLYKTIWTLEKNNNRQESELNLLIRNQY